MHLSKWCSWVNHIFHTPFNSCSKKKKYNFSLHGYFYWCIDNAWKCLSPIYGLGDLTQENGWYLYLECEMVTGWLGEERNKNHFLPDAFFFLKYSCLLPRGTVVSKRSHVLVEITHAKPLKLMTKHLCSRFGLHLNMKNSKIFRNESQRKF